MFYNEIRLLGENDEFDKFFESASTKFKFKNDVIVSIWMDSENPEKKRYFGTDIAQVAVISKQIWIAKEYPDKDKLEYNEGVFYGVGPDDLAEILVWAKNYKARIEISKATINEF